MQLTLNYHYGSLNYNENMRPITIAFLLKQCTEAMCPNLSVILKIDATLPLTCECERSFSVL